MSARSSASSAAAISMGEYAPSPNTCSIALLRANQLRVQTLLRQLLAPASKTEDEPNRHQQQTSASTATIRQHVDVLRVLRRTLRELDFELSWLTQVDFFETLERILRDDHLMSSSSTSSSSTYYVTPDSWRLIDDATKLLIEAIPRFRFDIEQQTLANILASVVQNLGHQRSEVRRSSLLLINMYLTERPQEFQQFLRLFIDYGLANHRNEQAQRGAILSLPLLMSEQVVGKENLSPLIGCLSELLVDSGNSRLFYSLFLALQRLHLTIGDQRFAAYLDECSPEAMMLYRQAASRSNSLAAVGQQQQQQQPQQPEIRTKTSRLDSTSDNPKEDQQEEPSKQVTFEADIRTAEQQQQQHQSQVLEDHRQERQHSSEDTSHGSLIADIEDEAIQHRQQASNNIESPFETMESSSSESPEHTTERFNGTATDKHTSTGKQLRRQVYSSVSSTCSSEANLVDPSHYMSEAALSGRPLSGFEQIHHIDHSCTGLAINDLGICCTPTMELGPGAENELKFGIFPKHLVWMALKQAGRLSDRLDALEEIMCIVRDSPINHLAILMTYFDSFLEQFIGRLLEPGTEYKLELCAIDMIETLVIKTKLSTIQYVRPIVSLLARTIGDSRQVFRDNTVRVLHKMMAYLPPQHVIDALFEHKHHRQASVREECINRVTAAVLEYDRQEFNLTKLCYHVLPMLADHHASVRLAALECIAALAHALGQERIGSLLTAAEAVQTGCDYDGLLDAIHARLMRRTLPRFHSDGSIGYVIKPFLNLANASFHQEHQAADVRWILEAPSSHQHVGGGGGDHHLPRVAAAMSPHAHRPGVYSPPPADVQQRQQQQQQMRRRSSLTHLIHASTSTSSNESTTANEPHHHHHHHHHHPTKTRRHNQRPTTESSVVASETVGQPAACRKQSSAEAKLATETHKRRVSLAKEATESEILTTGANERQHETCCPVEPSNDNNSCSSDKLAHSSSSSISRRRASNKTTSYSRRSNSQDSASSSSDTNKVLFQYYLGKFKQSLNYTNGCLSSTNGVASGAGSGKGNTTAVLLPSDSLIYTDTAQAYALTQHQTRQQQTSFDYDTDSVGKIPTAGTKKEKIKQRKQQVPNKNVAENMARQMSREAAELSAMPAAASSGNESSVSPQTVIEQHQSQPESQRKEDSIQQQHQTDQDAAPTTTTTTMRERRKSLARQRASEAGLARDRRDDDEQNIHQAAASNSAASSRPRSNSERLARDDRDASRSRPTTRKGELTRQCASMVADYAPSGEHDISMSPNTAELENHNRADEQEKEQDRRLSRGRSSRRSRQAHLRASGEAEALYHQLAADANGDDDDSAGGAVLDTLEDGAGGGAQQDREVRRRASRSQPPAALSRHSTGSTGSHHEVAAAAAAAIQPSAPAEPSSAHTTTTRRAVSVSPSLASSVNIRHILENVADIEGPFQDPHLALKVSMEALGGPCWSTKVEGMLALIRLASFHQPLVLAHLHEIISHTANETRNLRSTVARSAVFTLGDLCAKLKRSVEPELDLIVQSLLNKSIENTSFIRDDIRKALSVMVEQLTQWRLANSLMLHGTNHKNVHVRRMASQFVAQLVDRMGAAKCLVGARDISSQLIPAVARFAQDNSPHTRYYGRLILSKIMHHGAFERLLRKNLSPNLYRSTVGIIESVKRRGAGDLPSEN